MNEQSAKTKPPPMKPKAARVFVCSTFADMAQERDRLIKRVFPHLRDLCREQNFQLVDVDLNWGLANDPTDTKAILEIVDNELNQASICLALLGERFGRIPDGEFDSWTALSIYAALASKSTRLLALKRDTSLTQELAQTSGPTGRLVYCEQNENAALEQRKLIRRMEWLKVPLIPYTSLEDFTKQATDNLYRALAEMFFSKRGTVFISYSRKNLDAAIQLQQMLESAGFTVWLDVKGIALGDEWLKKITEGIEVCDAVLLLVSNECVRSEYAIREIHYAVSEKKPILAYHLESVELPKDIKFLLGTVQHLEASAFKSFEAAFEAIVSSLSRHIPNRGQHLKPPTSGV